MDGLYENGRIPCPGYLRCPNQVGRKRWGAKKIN